MYYRKNETVYFDSFGVKYVAKEIKEFVGNKNIKSNTFRVQANNSVICGYFCIGFMYFMFASKTLINFTNLLRPYDFEKDDSIILSYFKD